jgi:hypothetical protein
MDQVSKGDGHLHWQIEARTRKCRVPRFARPLTFGVRRNCDMSRADIAGVMVVMLTCVGCAAVAINHGRDTRGLQVIAIGQVALQCGYPYKEGMTVQQLFLLAGGFSNRCAECAHNKLSAPADVERADNRHPVLVCRGKNEIRVKREDRESFLLEPGDVVRFGHYRISF